MSYKIQIEKLRYERPYQVVICRANFIKTVSDVYYSFLEVHRKRVGVVYTEASEKRQILVEGNCRPCIDYAISIAKSINSGHYLVLVTREFPISFLSHIKKVSGLVEVEIATGNEIHMAYIYKEGLGNIVLGFSDGFGPLSIETPTERSRRIAFLQSIHYLPKI